MRRRLQNWHLWWKRVYTQHPIRRIFNAGFASLIGPLLLIGVPFGIWLLIVQAPLDRSIPVFVLTFVALLAWAINRYDTFWGTAIFVVAVTIFSVFVITPVAVNDGEFVIHVLLTLPLILATRFISPRSGWIALFGLIVSYAFAVQRIHPEHLRYLAFVIGSVDIAVVAIVLVHGSHITWQALSDYQSAIQTLRQAYDETLKSLVRTLDARDRETEGHSQRVTQATLLLCQNLGISGEALTAIKHGALLHDIGKIGIPDSILKKPGPLTIEEWAIMRQHPALARNMLEPVAFLRDSMDIPYLHHERWNGSGYPLGLQGESIPLAARIFALVDVWDAMRSDRPYRSGMSDDGVFAYLREQAGLLFDPNITHVFVQMYIDGQLASLDQAYRRS